MQQLLTDVSGMSFPALLQKEVLGPLGMKHSTFEQPLTAALAATAARAQEKDVAVPGRLARVPRDGRGRALDDAERPRHLVDHDG